MSAPARPFDAVRALLLERARARRNPFTHTDPAAAERVLAGLASTAPGEWVDAFGREASAAEAAADAADRAGTGDVALWRSAYGWWRVARYPAPITPRQREAYRRSQRCHLAAARSFAPPLARVEIPFRGRPGEGDRIVALLRRPSLPRPPVLVVWGGIDAFKEERRTDAYLAAGMATLAIDMPGTGDAPLGGSADAERLWDDVFAWLDARADIDAGRVAVVGSSTGGYWAAKLARTHRTRIRAAVDHGGPVQGAFAAEWIERAQVGEYPFALAETLAAAFGGRTYDDWLRIAPGLSLVAQGVLARPSAPLLAVHGVDDSVFPVADAKLLADHGADTLVTPGGHMGSGDVAGAIVRWLAERLRA